MNRNPSFMRARTNVFGAFARHHGTAREIVRILDRYQSSRRYVIGRLDMYRRGYFVPGQDAAAVVAFHRPRNSTGESGHGRHLEVVDVTTLFDDNFLSGLGVQLDSG